MPNIASMTGHYKSFFTVMEDSVLQNMKPKRSMRVENHRDEGGDYKSQISSVMEGETE